MRETFVNNFSTAKAKRWKKQHLKKFLRGKKEKLIFRFLLRHHKTFISRAASRYWRSRVTTTFLEDNFPPSSFLKQKKRKEKVKDFLIHHDFQSWRKLTKGDEDKESDCKNTKNNFAITEKKNKFLKLTNGREKSRENFRHSIKWEGKVFPFLDML